MTALSLVALHGMAHSFIELCWPLRHDKAVIQFQVNSKVIQLYITFFFLVLSIVGYNKVSSRVPCSIQQILLFILHIVVCTPEFFSLVLLFYFFPKEQRL